MCVSDVVDVHVVLEVCACAKYERRLVQGDEGVYGGYYDGVGGAEDGGGAQGAGGEGGVVGV